MNKKKAGYFSRFMNGVRKWGPFAWKLVTRQSWREANLNNQIRDRFVQALEASDFDEMRVKDKRTAEEYIRRQKRLSGLPLFRFLRWSGGKSILANIAGFITPLYALAIFVHPGVALAGGLILKLGSMARKWQEAHLKRLEHEFEKSAVLKKAGLVVPGQFASDDNGKLLYNGQAQTPVFCAFPVLYQKNQEFVVARFDAEKSIYEVGTKVPAAALEGLINARLQFADIARVEKELGHSEDARTCVYAFANLFPASTLQDNIDLAVSLDPKIRKSGLSAAFDRAASWIKSGRETSLLAGAAKILKALNKATLFSPLAGKISAEDLKSLAAEKYDMTERRAADIVALVQSFEGDKKLSFREAAELAKNDGGWSKDFIAVWQAKNDSRFGFNEIKEVAQNYQKWGALAAEVMPRDYAQKLSFEQIRDIARQDKVWGQTYRELHELSPVFAAKASHDELKRVASTGLAAAQAVDELKQLKPGPRPA